jgi:predicted metal-dependent enzyme (double-stranded beta helix superfamily)
MIKYNNNINNLIKNIKNTYNGKSKYTNMYKLLNNTIIKPNDIYNYQNYNIKNKYNKLLLYNDEYNLYKLYFISWGPNSYSPQHYHEMNCFMKLLDGELQQVFIINNNIFDKTTKKDDVSFINNYIGTHSVSNLSKDFSYSLNLYYKD